MAALGSFFAGTVATFAIAVARPITQGDPGIFAERPISLVMLVATALLLALMILPSFRKTREEAFQKEDA